VSFDAITLCIASQQVFIVVISLQTQSGNIWIHPRTFIPVGEGKTKHSEMNGSKHSPDLICSLFHRVSNPGLSLPFPNI
jgi:hypothetical protein